MEQYADVVLDLAGNAVEGATVQVLAGSGNAQSAYQTAAQIFGVNGAAQTNPITTGERGEFAFQAANGKYVLRVMVRGTVYDTLGPFTFYDPADDTERLAPGSVDAAVAAAVAPLEAKQARIRDAEDFGAVGDGVADDRAAIQQGLDALGAAGGTALLRLSRRYRITSGLKLPSHVGIAGPAPVRYPYNNATPAPTLVADFTNPNQWVIEPKTTHNGAPVPYNVVLGGFGLPTGPTFNCSVLNLLTASVGVMPYGGIRMHGCPGSVVRDVGIVGPSIGLLVNKCFGGEYLVHTITPHYGVIAWGETNANRFDIYTTQGTTHPTTVPAAYRFAGLVEVTGNFTTTLGLSTESHLSRPFGLIIGAGESTSSSNEVSFTTEYFPGGVFLYNARGTVCPRAYLEGESGAAEFGIVGAFSDLAAPGMTVNLGSTATMLDPGVWFNCDVRPTGVINFAALKPPGRLANTSRAVLRGVSRVGLASPVAEPNVTFPDDPGGWTLATLINGWTNAGGINENVAYRHNPLSGRVEFRGVAVGGTDGQAAFIVPAGHRKTARGVFLAPVTGGSVPVGQVVVLATGEVIPATVGMSANGLDFGTVQYTPEQ